ncbi:LLM class flavin-dependent oxidoreductase [Kutzneria viridogrisea]|uniref:Alkanesulfonate monooxygenase SsuD/methylene tetrahydromethanopterin reductase-like flavin-dependent oxidoreductase (Luciferase family) n=1 Tax=Kutzneria viridogrisea TaxID=47990 RepID=A0ABR6BM42_9PSEU|nr:alkanesulfonate monooxygenase SsuD/methylene tetrahydromethanopterin reductase-like flavin-dependent oxidoreductase (luciferase family) [Kutzneria viridogrisea]
MVDRRFRFGVIAGPEYTGAQWRAVARRAEESGYSTLLMPDGLHLLAPLPAAAVAAAVTTTLRVGTFVLASTVRQPRTAAWEANSLATLTDNRFELGIGTGNPWMNRAAVDEIGMPATTAAQRLARVRRTVEHLRGLETKTRTPVMIAAGGRRSRALAGQLADIVTLPHGPLASRREVKQMIAETADAAGERAGQIEYSMNILVLGDSIPRWIVPLVGEDLNALIEADSLLMLRGSPHQMADEIQRRRDAFGYSYITVNALHLDRFAPVVELLHGR